MNVRNRSLRSCSSPTRPPHIDHIIVRVEQPRQPLSLVNGTEFIFEERPHLVCQRVPAGRFDGDGIVFYGIKQYAVDSGGGI